MALVYFLFNFFSADPFPLLSRVCSEEHRVSVWDESCCLAEKSDESRCSYQERNGGNIKLSF